MEFETIKDIADKALLQARSLLTIDKFFYPTILAVNENDVHPTSCVIKNRKDKERIAQLLSELSKISEAIIFIMDSFVKEIPKETALETVPDLERDPESDSALVCFLFMKDKTLIRQVRYSHTNNVISFPFDFGWVETNETGGIFKNPYES